MRLSDLGGEADHLVLFAGVGLTSFSGGEGKIDLRQGTRAGAPGATLPTMHCLPGKGDRRAAHFLKWEEAFPKLFGDFSIINLDMERSGLYNKPAR
jgi:hypothetical protein